MLNRKLFITLGIVAFTFTGVSFGYTANSSLYCNIQNINTKSQSIKISLSKSDGGQCTQYVKYLEQKMKSTYKDILTIQGYINKRQDAGYRRPIKDEKTKLLNDMQKRRLSILLNMRTFERNLVEKSKELFLAKIQTNKKKLEAALIKIDALSGSSGVDKYAQQARNVLNAIRNIEKVTTITKFNEKVKEYIYFAKQLGGK